MYHPTRGGVRGGRDQFTWDDVKVDKHRENYLGHSIKAPVGRWQKGKDLHWYTRDKNADGSNSDAMKEEIKRIKEEEEQAMREALGLAPKRSSRPKGSRLDKHEFSELVKRDTTAEDVGAGHAEAAWVHGLGFAKAPRPWEDPSTLPSNIDEVTIDPPKVTVPEPSTRISEPEVEVEVNHKKRKHEERKHGKEKRRDKHERHDKHRSRDSDDRRKHKKDKEKRRHDSD